MAVLINYTLIGLLFILYIILLMTLENKVSFKYKKGILIVTIITLSVFAGYRTIGTDTESYRTIFENLPITLMNLDFFRNIFENPYEPGFMLIVSYLKKNGYGFNILLIIFAIVPLLIMYRTIVKSEKRFVFLTFLLFLMIYAVRGPLDVIRQFFAAAIYFSALYSLSEGKNFSYLGKNLIGSISFHFSSIITILVRPFIKISWNIKTYLITFIGLLVTGTLLKETITFIIKEMNFSNRFLDEFQHYIDVGYPTDGFLEAILLYSMWFLPIILNIVINIVMLKQKNKYKYNNNQFIKVLLNSQIIGTLIFIFLWSMGAIVMGRRLEFTLSIGNFFLLKEIIVRQQGKNKFILIFILIYLFLYFMSQTLFFVY